VRALAALAILLLPAAQVQAPLARLRATLQHVAAGLDRHQDTNGAVPELTDAKHQLRDWIESRLAGTGQNVDALALGDTLHTALRGAGLLCDDCDFNYLGYLDDVRVSRQGEFLVVVTAAGINCGYDESAYAYAWRSGKWQRVWERENDTYTAQGYLPQVIEDLQISPPDAAGDRLLMLLGSQTLCAGSFKNVYARVWRLGAEGGSTPLLDRTERASDEYPPIEGRVRPDDVIFTFTAGGFIAGDTHPAVRHFRIEGGAAVQVDPIAGRPRDFVDEWLSAPWEESRTRSESASLQTAHAALSRGDGVGDFAEPTLRCSGGPDLWQVTTHLYERPKRYFRVRWRAPYHFTMVGVSDTPYPDCTMPDTRSEVYPDLFDAELR
jgi:hypothetical protein